jgi:hypothetical protein
MRDLRSQNLIAKRQSADSGCNDNGSSVKVVVMAELLIAPRSSISPNPELASGRASGVVSRSVIAERKMCRYAP